MWESESEVESISVIVRVAPALSMTPAIITVK